MKGALTEIIQLATLDSDPWVLMVADILKSFPDTGSLNLDLEEQNPNVQDILGELREKGKPFLLVKITEIWCLFSEITCHFTDSLVVLIVLVWGQAVCLNYHSSWLGILLDWELWYLRNSNFLNYLFTHHQNLHVRYYPECEGQPIS